MEENKNSYYTPASGRAAMKYREKNYKRVSLDLKKEFYEEIKEVTDQTGESVPAFIRRAISELINAEKEPPCE